MDLASRIRQLGRIMISSIWLPSIGVFAGLLGVIGEPGRIFAAWVDQYLPGLISDRAILTVVSLMLAIAMTFGGIALIFGASLFAGIQNRRVLHSGKPAQARVVAAQSVGTSIRNQPVMRFTLQVLPEGEPPFHAETERMVSSGQWAAWQPGADVQVAYDPETLQVALRD